MAIKESGLIGRQDKLLSFGETATLSATGDNYCGYSASYTDGVCLDMFNGDTNPKAAPASLAGFAVHFKVEAAVTGTGTVKGTFFVEVSADKSSWTKVASSPAIGSSDLTADKEFNVVVPRGSEVKRYVRAGITTAGTTITGGKVSAVVDTFAGI